MRRLFHGRMITVDGHMRRMDENYNKYVILTDSGQGFALENKVRENNPVVGKKIEWSPNNTRLTIFVPIKANYTYVCKPTSDAYLIYIGLYDTNERFVRNQDTGWQPSINFTPEIDGYFYFTIRNASNPDALMFPGEVGGIVTKEE